MYSKYSRYSGKKVQTLEVKQAEVKAVPNQITYFSIEQKLLKVFNDDVEALEVAIHNVAKKVDGCEIVNITFTQNHSAVKFNIEISAQCGAVFNRLLSDLRSDIKEQYKVLDKNSGNAKKKSKTTTTPACA